MCYCPFFSQTFCPACAHLLIIAGVAVLLLSGCVPSMVNHNSQNGHNARLSEYQLADFLSKDCQRIWQLSDRAIENNPLYWLCSMDCATRLTTAVARIQAQRWQDNIWQDTFKRAILLASANITPVERRRNLAAVDAWRLDIPPQIRLLYGIWHDAQALQLAF